MILLIDGYNILKLIHGPSLSDTQKSAFITLLGRYIKKRQHKVIVVFDAGPCIYPMHEKQHGVTVVYSGAFQSADDSIVKLSKEHSSKEVIVISADRALLQEAAQYHADSIEPLVFYEKVKEVCRGSDVLEKHKNDRSIIKFEDKYADSFIDIDDLMYEAAAMRMPEKDETDYTALQVKKNDISKKDRVKNKALNKL